MVIRTFGYFYVFVNGKAIAFRNKKSKELFDLLVETVEGRRRTVAEKVTFDLYDYLSGKEEFSQLFKGSYFTNYSWAESTLAALSNNY